jgi:hypothetical protein
MKLIVPLIPVVVPSTGPDITFYISLLYNNQNNKFTLKKYYEKLLRNGVEHSATPNATHIHRNL